MKKFLKQFSVFLLGVLLINFMVYLFVDPIYSQNEYKARFIQQIETFSTPVNNTLLLADSHGLLLDDALLSKSGIINISNGSDSYADMLNK
ncbi:MAG: hypothetical protein EHM28_07310, partial [Spirochaetaceae bacterium]